MSLIFLPLVDPSAATFGCDSDNLSHRTRKGYVYTVGRNVHPWVCTLSFLNQHNKSTTEKAQIAAAVAEARGEENRFIFGPHAASKRGAFPTVELLPNPMFANALTGWVLSINHSGAVQDRVARFTRKNWIGTSDVLSASAASTVTQYGAYVARSFDILGRGSFLTGVQLGSTQADEDYGRTTVAGGGMKTLAAVIQATSVWFGLVDYQTAPNQAGDFYEVPYTSLARCLLVDAGPNAFLHSDAIDNAAWAKSGCTVSSGVVAPDGTSTAERVVEDTLTSTHDVAQAVIVTAAAQDISVSFSLARNGRDFARIFCTENASGTNCSAFFNLLTGAIGTIASGANLINTRAHIVPQGTGWYRCTLTFRKSNAATSINAFVGPATADGTASYLGNGASGTDVWRAGFALSSVPVRGVQTTTAATTGTSPTGGTLHVKGGRSPSEGALAGALLKDDFFEVLNAAGGSSLHKMVAPLNLDEAGGGYAQFTPPLIETIADNAAIIVANPLAKWRLTDTRQMWSNKPGFFSDFELEFEQDLTP